MSAAKVGANGILLLNNDIKSEVYNGYSYSESDQSRGHTKYKVAIRARAIYVIEE